MLGEMSHHFKYNPQFPSTFHRIMNIFSWSVWDLKCVTEDNKIKRAN